MGNLARRVIHCPNKADHPNQKLLMLIGEHEIDVHCSKHKWLKIELFKNGIPINFKGVSARISEIDNNVKFDLEPIPGIALGEFKNKRKKSCQTKVSEPG